MMGLILAYMEEIIMEITIPAIFEENIDSFTYSNANAIFKYHCDVNEEIHVVFKNVYVFSYIESDYLDYAEKLLLNREDWKFGLQLIENSPLLAELIKDNFPNGDTGRAFGGEIEMLKHYRLSVDDDGFYNIICKGLEIKKNF